jgi:hypothetical protein
MSPFVVAQRKSIETGEFQVFEETDTDFDDRLTYSEFHQVVVRAPDFVR